MAWLLEFRLLGPVEPVIDGRPVRLPAAKPRALLAVLLLDRNRVVSVGRLVEDLWGDDPPETATKALQGYVSQLRKALGGDRLLTKPPGYSLRVEDGELVGNEPLRERPRAQLMLALYRSGRQAAALELYRRTRETLSDELGIEPSLELQELERRMLQHDPTLERARAPARQAEDGAPVPLARRPQFLVLAAPVPAMIAAVIAAVALTSGGSSGKGASGSGELRSFVDKLENFL